MRQAKGRLTFLSDWVKDSPKTKLKKQRPAENGTGHFVFVGSGYKSFPAALAMGLFWGVGRAHQLVNHMMLPTHRSDRDRVPFDERPRSRSNPRVHLVHFWNRGEVNLEIDRRRRDISLSSLRSLRSRRSVSQYKPQFLNLLSFSNWNGVNRVNSGVRSLRSLVVLRVHFRQNRKVNGVNSGVAA